MCYFKKHLSQDLKDCFPTKVIICFGAAVVNCQLSAYLAWSLVVEVNGRHLKAVSLSFLHILFML